MSFSGEAEHNVSNVGRRRGPRGGQQAEVPGDVRPALQQCQVGEGEREELWVFQVPFNRGGGGGKKSPLRTY